MWRGNSSGLFGERSTGSALEIHLQNGNLYQRAERLKSHVASGVKSVNARVWQHASRLLAHARGREKYGFLSCFVVLLGGFLRVDCLGLFDYVGHLRLILAPALMLQSNGLKHSDQNS